MKKEFFMNNTVKWIIEGNIELINQNKFEKVLEEALQSDVADELLDTFYKAKVNVPVEQMQAALINSRCMNTEEKEQKLLTLQYLINKNQLTIFKVLGQ